MELFIILYLISVILFFIFEVGYTHGHYTEKYPILMYRKNSTYKVPWIFHTICSILWPSALLTTFVLHRGGGWVWPKKGVTYLKEKN